jgi:hypothetical protein
MSNRRESTAADIISWERALNGAILTADISRGYEEYLEIFDRFYAEDIQATTETQKEPIVGKATLRAWLADFLVPLHVFAEICGVSVSVQHRPIRGDRSDEMHGAWTLEVRGTTGRSCRQTWGCLRRWRAGRVISEHHYDHSQVGGPLTESDLLLKGDGMNPDAPTRLEKQQ